MSRPIRVAQIVGKMVGGGVETVVMNYYRYIDRAKIQFDFLVDADSKFVPKDEIEALGGRVLMVPPYQHAAAYHRKLEQLFREQKWRIVHSHINALSVFPLHAAKEAGVPVRIAHSHSTSGKGEHAKNAIKILLKKLSNIYPTHRFACSEIAGEWLFGTGSKFEIVRNAIELDNFVFDDTIRRNIRRQLCIPDDTFVVGHVGRFVPQKNHVFLLAAFGSLCQKRSNSILLLAGEGELRAQIEEKTRGLGLENRVRFLGQRDDVASLYQAFDVFALPSLYEGLGIVGVEAQRAGLPCVFANTITKEVSLTSKACFLPLGDAQTWAEALSSNTTSRDVDPSAFSEYDIITAAKGLEEKYISLIEGLRC